MEPAAAQHPVQDGHGQEEGGEVGRVEQQGFSAPRPGRTVLEDALGDDPAEGGVALGREMHAVLGEVRRGSKRRAPRRLEHVDGARGSAAGDAPDGPREERNLRGERRARIAVDERRVLDEVVDAHPRELLLGQLEVRPVGRHEIELDRARGGERGHRRQRGDQLALAPLLVFTDPLGRSAGVGGGRLCVGNRRARSGVSSTRLEARMRIEGQAGRAPQPAPRRPRVVEHAEQSAPARAAREERPPPGERGDAFVRRRYPRPQRRPACPPDLQVDDHHNDVRPKLVHVGLQQRGHVDDAEGVGAEVEYLGLAARRKQRRSTALGIVSAKRKVEPVHHRRSEHRDPQDAGSRRRRVRPRGVHAEIVGHERLLAGHAGP